MRKIILNESDIACLVKEAVSRILNEIGDTPRGQYRLGRLDARYMQRMMDADNENERERMYSRANDINDYAESQIHPEDYDNEEDLYAMPTSYRLGYKDELGGTTATDSLLDYFGYENRLNNPEKESEFRKKHLKDVSIV